MMRPVARAGDRIAFAVAKNAPAGRIPIDLGARYACSVRMKCAAQQRYVPATGNRRPIPFFVGAPDVKLLVDWPKGTGGVLPCLFHIQGGDYVAGSVKCAEPMYRPIATIVKLN